MFLTSGKISFTHSDSTHSRHNLHSAGWSGHVQATNKLQLEKHLSDIIFNGGKFVAVQNISVRFSRTKPLSNSSTKANKL